jgi:hypothetical protein
MKLGRGRLEDNLLSEVKNMKVIGHAIDGN